MPLYDYRCAVCGDAFEARHAFDAAAPACPHCGASAVERLITSAPAVMQGMAADAGRGGRATKEQMQSKWAEETPKLREQLVSKLGEETVRKHAPTLGTSGE